MARIVMVHGRRQEHEDPGRLKEEWLAALRRGAAQDVTLTMPPNSDFRFVYYGQALAGALAGQPSPPAVITQGTWGSLSEEFQIAYVGLLREYQSQLGVSDDAVRRILDDDRAAADEPDVLPQSFLNWKWVRALATALDRSSLRGAAVALFTSDVYRYLSDAAIRTAIDAQVRQAIVDAAEGGPVRILAHSLGSVVTYRVLKQVATDLRVDRWVTIGAPLGIRAIREWLEPPILTPPCVASWSNFRDPQDFVALRSIESASNGALPRLREMNVENTAPLQHEASGYLCVVDVARAVLADLSIPPHASIAPGVNMPST